MELYLYGYQGTKVDALRQEADRLGAQVFDTRYRPWSPRSEWCSGPLERELQDRYLAAGKWLGNVEYKTGGLRLADAAVGIDLVVNALRKTNVILLCACSDGTSCHRTHIARLVAERCGVVGRELRARALQPGLV